MAVAPRSQPPSKVVSDDAVFITDAHLHWRRRYAVRVADGLYSLIEKQLGTRERALLCLYLEADKDLDGDCTEEEISELLAKLDVDVQSDGILLAGRKRSNHEDSPPSDTDNQTQQQQPQQQPRANSNKSTGLVVPFVDVLHWWSGDSSKVWNALSSGSSFFVAGANASATNTTQSRPAIQFRRDDIAVNGDKDAESQLNALGSDGRRDEGGSNDLSDNFRRSLVGVVVAAEGMGAPSSVSVKVKKHPVVCRAMQSEAIVHTASAKLNSRLGGSGFSVNDRGLDELSAGDVKRCIIVFKKLLISICEYNANKSWLRLVPGSLSCSQFESREERYYCFVAHPVPVAMSGFVPCAVGHEKVVVGLLVWWW